VVQMLGVSRGWDRAHSNPGGSRRRNKQWECCLGVVIGTLFYLRYIMRHCSPPAADSAGDGEQGVYNYQADDQVVLGNDTRSR
jgi:hypothetical protein